MATRFVPQKFQTMGSKQARLSVSFVYSPTFTVIPVITEFNLDLDLPDHTTNLIFTKP